ncbi:MAG TPA: ParA family protein, partial [Steroidobacteraceae bacterium]|nr:ParA family protein [Steroidobacteraceae bacterium]
LIDCPPALNMLTVNSLVAADSVLIPMQCEYYALEGLSALLSTVEQIRAAVNPQLAIEGVLRTMFDPRNNLANEVSAQLIAHFGDRVFRTVIPRNIRLAEAPSFGKPALFHDKESRGALAYLALAGEMIRREEESSGTARTATAAPAHTASVSVPAPGVTPPGVAPHAAAPSVVPPPAPAAAPGATAAENEVTAHTPVTPAGNTATTAVEETEMAPAVSASPAPQAEDRSR